VSGNVRTRLRPVPLTTPARFTLLLTLRETLRYTEMRKVP
jgi:hypothetical protein